MTFPISYDTHLKPTTMMNRPSLLNPPAKRDLFYPPHTLPESSQPPPDGVLEAEVELVVPARQAHTYPPPKSQEPQPSEATVKTLQRYFTAYEFQDREAMEHLLSRNFSFCSPLNHRIDRATYFRECWPIQPQQTIRIERIIEKGTEAFVTYECQRLDGTYFQNTGFFILEDDKIRHLHIYCDSPQDMMPGV